MVRGLDIKTGLESGLMDSWIAATLCCCLEDGHKAGLQRTRRVAVRWTDTNVVGAAETIVAAPGTISSTQARISSSRIKLKDIKLKNSRPINDSTPFFSEEGVV